MYIYIYIYIYRSQLEMTIEAMEVQADTLKKALSTVYVCIQHYVYMIYIHMYIIRMLYTYIYIHMYVIGNVA